MLNKTCIISCGKKKIWDLKPNIGPQKAKDVYVGSFVNKLKEYANIHYKDWYILSAKYGIIHKDFIINEKYDVTFNDIGTKPILPIDIVIPIELQKIENIEVIAGAKYCNIINEVFKDYNVNIETPLLQFKGMGYQLQYITNIIKENKLKNKRKLF